MGERFYSSGSLRKATDKKGEPWKGILSFKDENGKWRQKTTYFRDCRRKTDARVAFNAWWEAMENEAQEKLLAGRPAVDEPRVTVAEAVKSFLDEQRRLNVLSIGTYQNQIRKLELNIAPYFEGKDFYKVTSADIADYISFLSEQYKPQTVRTTYAILSKAFKHAKRVGKLPDNPCEYAVLPVVDEHKINYLEEDARRKYLAIISMLPASDWRLITSSLAYYTGMRTSEICGLQWRDINFAVKQISVSRAARTIKNDVGRNIVIIKQPKSKAGKRTIPLLPQMEAILKAYLETFEQKPNPNDFVVEEKYRNPSCMSANILNWTKKVGLIGSQGRAVTLHGLRHTFATLGVQSGMDIKSLSSILGHAKADITLNVYASSDESAKRIAMSNLADFMKNEEESDL